MPKLENAVTHFKTDSIPYPKNTVNYQSQNEDTVGLYSVNDPEHRIIKGTLARFDDWTDLNDDPYTSFSQLTDDLDSFLFYVSGDYNLEVLRGNIIGHEMVSINCEIETLTTTRITIYPTGTTTDIDQSNLHSIAETVDVASDNVNDTLAGTGLRTLRLFGLDVAGNNQNEIITLTGQTEVTSAKIYSAINPPGFRGLTTGSENKSLGNIFIGNGTFTSGVPDTVYFVGEAGHNKGLTGYYTIPTGGTLFIRQLTMTMVGSNKQAKIHFETSSDGILWITENEFGLESGVAFQGQIKAVPGITAGNHLRLTGLAGGAGSELSVIIGAELIDD